MNYVLDTTLLVDHAHGVPAAAEIVAQLFSSSGDLLTCDAIVAEALSRGDDDHLLLVREILDVLEYVATTPEAAAWAGESRRKRGATSHRTLGDALIAGVAWFNKATIVTRNPDDFVAQGIPVLTYG